MKKKDIIELIRFHAEGNESAFRKAAYRIAEEFEKNEDRPLGEYIRALLSNVNAFVPQNFDTFSSFFERVNVANTPLYLPEVIQQDIMGLLHAFNKAPSVHKVMFQGAPGTGKTETVKHIARILNKELYAANFSQVIDSKLGQTQKNVDEMFRQISVLPHPKNVIILFDELDALAMDRTNTHDLREMGRVTSSILKELDELNKEVILIATTNLFEYFDKALLRRFDAVIDFNRYTRDDIVDVAINLCEKYLNDCKSLGKNTKLLKKIIKGMEADMQPGDLDNIIKLSIAFSDTTDKYEYLRRIYQHVTKSNDDNIAKLSEKGYTLREIEILTGVSKSKVCRELN